MHCTSLSISKPGKLVNQVGFGKLVNQVGLGTCTENSFNLMYNWGYKYKENKKNVLRGTYSIQWNSVGIIMEKLYAHNLEVPVSFSVEYMYEERTEGHHN